jgi:hypothetical protein
MIRVWWHICGRYCQMRAARAARAERAFAELAGKYFSRLGGGLS